MARIRTIKPEFFRHEGLQDLEVKHRGKYPMLVFAGLWTVCDKSGRFEWRPRQLKLDILPFLNFEMEESLSILHGSRFVFRYEVDGKAYGIIPTFTEHQRITGKEAQSPDKYPDPPEDYQGNNREIPETLPGITGDDLGAQERKGKRKGKDKASRESSEKILFLDDIRLTEKQHAALSQKFGESDTRKAIEYLNNYKMSRGKKYDSDYHTILNWVMGKVKENGNGDIPQAQEKKPDKKCQKCEKPCHETVRHRNLDLCLECYRSVNPKMDPKIKEMISGIGGQAK